MRSEELAPHGTRSTGETPVPHAPLLDMRVEHPRPERPWPIPPYQAPDVRVQPPLVYVEPAWEYKRVTRHVTDEELPSEAELDALGRDGWELTAVVPAGSAVHFYFKRQTQ